MMDSNSAFSLDSDSKFLKWVRWFNSYLFYPKNTDYEYNPLDMCSLIRATVVATFWTIVLTCAALIPIGIILLPIIQPIIFLLGYTTLSEFMVGGARFVLLIESLLLVAALVFYSVHLIETYMKKSPYWIKRRDKKAEVAYEKLKVYVNKQPHFIIQYIKDKHNKICRSIDIIEKPKPTKSSQAHFDDDDEPEWS